MYSTTYLSLFCEKIERSQRKIAVLNAAIKSKSRKVNKLRISNVSSRTCSFIMHAASVKPKLSISAADRAKPPLAPGKAFFKS